MTLSRIYFAIYILYFYNNIIKSKMKKCCKFVLSSENVDLKQIHNSLRKLDNFGLKISNFKFD